MAKYRLDTGLTAVREEPEFETDAEAWEYLRKILPNKIATLYKQQKIEVPINNRKEYIKLYNAKYTLQKIKGKNEVNVWIPILDGITNHAYNIQ